MEKDMMAAEAEKNHTSLGDESLKEIYKKLRLLFIVSVILATVTLVGFSYIVLNDLSSHMWKYQWL